MLIKVTSRSFSKHPVLRQELLSAFPRTVFNDDGKHYSQDDLISFLKDAEGAVVGLEQVTEEVLAACPDLKILAKFGVGLDNLDLDACERRGVAIGWRCGGNRHSVAELTLVFMMLLSRRLFGTCSKLKEGIWEKDGGRQLNELTIGIIGVGHIGKEVIRLLKPFGCRILVNDVVEQNDYYEEAGVLEVSKMTIYETADIITVHTPLTDLTRGLLNRDVFARMKPEGLLINTARGRIVVQDDLKLALQAGHIAGAAVDVYEEEPPQDLELLQLPNLICTPHIGGGAQGAVLAMGRCAIERLREFFRR